MQNLNAIKSSIDMKTAEDFKNAVEKNNIREYFPRRCSICSEYFGYVFKDEKIYFDSNCGCFFYKDSACVETTWYDLSTLYNRNLDNKEFTAKMNKKFGF